MPFAHRYRIRFWALLAGLIAANTALAQIPQVHSYQITLRTYLGTLDEADFEVDLQPIIYDPAYFATMDDLHRTWILMEDRGRKMPANTGLRVDAGHFTLASIERDGSVYMQVGRNSGFFDPLETAWWVAWDYPGNPYFQHPAGINRAFAAAAVDLILTEHNLESTSANRRSDYVGGYLARLAYVYYVVKPTLPPDIQAAYEDGLRRIFDRLTALYPSGNGGADMETFQLAGLWYAAEAIDDDALRSRALNHSRYVLNVIMKGDGHFHEHGDDGIDLSYEGIAQRFIAWAALLYNDATIDGYLERSAHLKAHQTLPEPDGGFTSPSHFNTGTVWGSATDQWHTYARDHAVAMTTDEAKYLVWTGRTLGPTYFQGLPDEAQMRADIALAISQRNADTDGSLSWTWNAASTAAPQAWAPQHWLNGAAPAADLYPAGFYDQLSALSASGSALMKPPMLREPGFIEVFGEDFVVARFGTYGAIVHTGTTVATWANGVPGLSGGALSAFWTEAGGTALLGMSRGAQNAVSDQWTGTQGWETWAVHAISGVNAAGQPFSSARNRIPTVQRTIEGDERATIVVSGAIGAHDGGLSAPGGAIAGDVDYTRTFTLAESGVTITSTLVSDGSDAVGGLWEMVPIYLRDAGQADGDARIEWRVGPDWIPASTDLQAGVMAIRTTRFDQPVQLVFEEPRRVKLSPAVWTSMAVGARIQNVMIDLLGADGVVAMPAMASVTYTLAPSSSIVYGDPSGNGEISALDAALVLEHVAGQQLLGGNALLAADVTGNGLVTPLDASYILQFVVGILDCLPADSACVTQ